MNRFEASIELRARLSKLDSYTLMLLKLAMNRIDVLPLEQTRMRESDGLYVSFKTKRQAHYDAPYMCDIIRYAMNEVEYNSFIISRMTYFLEDEVRPLIPDVWKDEFRDPDGLGWWRTNDPEASVKRREFFYLFRRCVRRVCNHKGI